MKKTLTCIVCPNGCEITAETDGMEGFRITGATCPRGEEYAVQEIKSPMRTVSSSVRIIGGELPLVSVRLNAPVPKERIFDVMRVINDICLTAPVRVGELAAENVLGLGSNVIVTKNVAAAENAKEQAAGAEEKPAKSA